MEMGEALVRRHTRCRVRHRALFDWSSGSQVPAQLLVYAATGLGKDSAYGWLWLLRFILVFFTTGILLSPNFSSKLVHVLLAAALEL
jgi:hypothetical protein